MRDEVAFLSTIPCQVSARRGHARRFFLCVLAWLVLCLCPSVQRKLAGVSNARDNQLFLFLWLFARSSGGTLRVHVVPAFPTTPASPPSVKQGNDFTSSISRRRGFSKTADAPRFSFTIRGYYVVVAGGGFFLCRCFLVLAGTQPGISLDFIRGESWVSLGLVKLFVALNGVV